MKTIHVVEDDDEFRELWTDWLYRQLNRDDVQIVDFSDPVAYVHEVLAHARPDVLVTDHCMPGLSGVHLAYAVLESPVRCKIIVYTADERVRPVGGLEVYFKKGGERYKLVDSIRSFIQ